MKYIKLRNEALASAILAYFYAVEGTPEGDAIHAKRLEPLRSDGQVGEQGGLTELGKDIVKELSGAKRIPRDFMIGDIVTIAANNGKPYYFVFIICSYYVMYNWIQRNLPKTTVIEHTMYIM